jgi:hypothetical protein
VPLKRETDDQSLGHGVMPRRYPTTARRVGAAFDPESRRAGCFPQPTSRPGSRGSQTQIEITLWQDSDNERLVSSEGNLSRSTSVNSD